MASSLQTVAMVLSLPSSTSASCRFLPKAFILLIQARM